MSKSSISDELRQRVAETAKHRCGYCQTQELIIGMPLQIEHIYPEAAGGDSDETNLWLACPRCNRYKSDRTHGSHREDRYFFATPRLLPYLAGKLPPNFHKIPFGQLLSISFAQPIPSPHIYPSRRPSKFENWYF